MAMTLTKIIPARTQTLTAAACRKDYYENNETFRKVRKNCRNKMDKCHWCKRAFVDGEKMSFVMLSEKHGNQVLCGKCCDQLLASEDNSKDKE